MTPKEAIEYLNIMKLSTEDDSVGEIKKEVCDIAIKALEKQIPKKPKTMVIQDGLTLNYDGFEVKGKVRWCRNCNKPITVDIYCRWCGQKIDLG